MDQSHPTAYPVSYKKGEGYMEIDGWYHTAGELKIFSRMIYPLLLHNHVFVITSVYTWYDPKVPEI
jgi:hypothetical protein